MSKPSCLISDQELIPDQSPEGLSAKSLKDLWQRDVDLLPVEGNVFVEFELSSFEGILKLQVAELLAFLTSAGETSFRFRLRFSFGLRDLGRLLSLGSLGSLGNLLDRREGDHDLENVLDGLEDDLLRALEVDHLLHVPEGLLAEVDDPEVLDGEAGEVDVTDGLPAGNVEVTTLRAHDLGEGGLGHRRDVELGDDGFDGGDGDVGDVLLHG